MKQRINVDEQLRTNWESVMDWLKDCFHFSAPLLIG